MTKDRDALLPCPFCGCPEMLNSSNGMDSHFLACADCGAEGPATSSEGEATAAWNYRAQPAPAESEGWRKDLTDLAKYWRTYGDTMASVLADSLDKFVAKHPPSPAVERQGWRPTSTAPYDTEFLVRGWGEGRKHYVFGFAKRLRNRSGGYLWEDTAVTGRNEELWFAPVDFMALPLPTAPGEGNDNG